MASVQYSILHFVQHFITHFLYSTYKAICILKAWPVQSALIAYPSQGNLRKTNGWPKEVGQLRMDQ